MIIMIKREIYTVLSCQLCYMTHRKQQKVEYRLHKGDCLEKMRRYHIKAAT